MEYKWPAVSSGGGSGITSLIGDVTASGSGAVIATIAANVIVNADINASAAIATSKLAALTASRAVVSDASGFITQATTTATEIGYVNGVTSAIQTQINTKLTNPMTTGGDIVYGGASGVPTRLANGSSGQLLKSNGSTSAPSWVTPANTWVDTIPGALDISWTAGDTFNKDVAANSTFTFSNLVAGKTIALIVRNTSGAPITITLPTVAKRTDIQLTINASKTNVYNFIYSNSVIYAACVGDLA